MSRNKIDRIGETNISNEGCTMKIAEYDNANNIIVEFEDEHKYRLHTSYQAFKKGKCKNPFLPQYMGMDIWGLIETVMYQRHMSLKMGNTSIPGNIINGVQCYKGVLIINIKRKSQLTKTLLVVKDGYVLLIY